MKMRVAKKLIKKNDISIDFNCFTSHGLKRFVSSGFTIKPWMKLEDVIRRCQREVGTIADLDLYK